MGHRPQPMSVHHQKRIYCAKWQSGSDTSFFWGSRDHPMFVFPPSKSTTFQLTQLQPERTPLTSVTPLCSYFPVQDSLQPNRQKMATNELAINFTFFGFFFRVRQISPQFAAKFVCLKSTEKSNGWLCRSRFRLFSWVAISSIVAFALFLSKMFPSKSMTDVLRCKISGRAYWQPKADYPIWALIVAVMLFEMGLLEAPPVTTWANPISCNIKKNCVLLRHYDLVFPCVQILY